MIGFAALVVLLPFAAALAGMLLGRRLRPALVAVVPMGLATVVSAGIAVTQWAQPGVRAGTLTMVHTAAVPIGVSLEVNGLAADVALMVCCVALAVQVYSVAYVHERYSSYAAFVSLFTAAMLLVVYAGDLLVLYVGWEVMGVCSYFLIGHHWEDRANSRAAVKAFLVTRIGDVGFLFGIFVLGLGAHTFSIDGVLAAPLSHTTMVTGTLLLLAGVAGKSAQFPLHTWLPDAMAGPTPISALIHAATMVAAGIYVVARLYPVFPAASLAVLGIMAAISMLGAALAALAQDDLKRVLAYSTISQLGFMAAGLAVGSRDAAVFHLLTHGAFKAVLFLGAGCVIGVTGSNLLRDMGGLRLMPFTFWSMTIGYAALAGLPPASGFFSKDAIIEAAQSSVFSTPMPRTASSLGGALPGWCAWIIYLTLLVTVLLTGAYAMRAWLLTFFGEPRGTYEIREAGPLMRWPLAALAAPALLLGWYAVFSGELRPHFGSAALALLLALAGAGVVFLIWNQDPALDPARRLPAPLARAFQRAFYLDEVYTVAIVRPAVALAMFVAIADHKVIDAGVEGTATGARGLAGVLRRAQNGNPQTYLTGLLAGVALIALAVVILT
ncbi:MAG: proton-translocating NADH-quinone oxidoreductase, chain [Actinomycetia bacterium]|nr:proton-translocating NADH-quinone oxidoreductase, chain [Actinomycetes bacterium]